MLSSADSGASARDGPVRRIYSRQLDGEEHVSISVRLDEGALHRPDGWSKTYAMTGWQRHGVWPSI